MKRGIFLEIAALVDVLLVILFLVLLQVAQTAEDVKAQAADSGAYVNQINELKSENAGLEKRLGTYSIFKKNCLILTISVEYEATESRTILVEDADSQETKTELTWDNVQYARNALRADLSSRIRAGFAAGDQMAFIVFQYDRNTVYQTDYSVVSSAILSQKIYPNVYSAEYDILGAKENG